MTPELKPCPFCGGKPSIMHGANKAQVGIWCDNDGCRIAETACTEASRVLWNRRTSAHPVTVEMLERAILDAQLRAFENGRIDTPDEIRSAAIAQMEDGT